VTLLIFSWAIRGPFPTNACLPGGGKHPPRALSLRGRRIRRRFPSHVSYSHFVLLSFAIVLIAYLYLVQPTPIARPPTNCHSPEFHSSYTHHAANVSIFDAASPLLVRVEL